MNFQANVLYAEYKDKEAIMLEFEQNTEGSVIQDVSEANFMQDVIEASKERPVIVDFWAPWCGPCKTIAPVLEEISIELKDKIKIIKINVDDNQEYAAKYGIQSIPTLLVFNKGELKNQIIGALPKNEIEKFLLDEI